MGYINNTFCNALKGKASGEVVSITDAAPMEHTVSVSVESKNVVEFPYTLSGTTTINGVSFTVNDDGTITVNGTPVRATYFNIWKTGVDNYSTFKPIENGTYTFSGCPTGGSASTYKLQFNYFADENATRKYIDDLGSGKQVVINGTAPRYDLWIVLYEGFTADNLVFKPQVEKGTVATSYTPYINELSNVKVLAMGKNWYNSTFTIGGLNGGTGNETSMNTRARVKDFIPVKENTYYKISGLEDYVMGTMAAYDANKNYLGSWAKGMTPTNTAYIRFNIRHNDDAQVFSDEELETINALPIQIEVGTTATEYTPYKEPVEVGETFTSYKDMVITTNTVGAIVNVDYNRDINKAFAAIAAATMGANV